MSTKSSPGHVRATHALIKAHRKEFSTRAMRRVLGVTPSGHCDWPKPPLSKRAIEAARFLRSIGASFTASHGIYGAPGFISPGGRQEKPAASIGSPG